jgi:glycine cleavage system H protein
MGSPPHLEDSMSRDPESLRFARTHEWVAVEGTQASVGISDHAQDQLGDVVYVELPDVGRSLSAGTAFGVVESVKAASDLYTPVEGRVTEVNARLAEQPEIVNQDPYGDGWMIRLEVGDGAVQALGALMSHHDYLEMIKAEAAH